MPRGLLAPELTRGEAHRVHVLRLLAEEMGVGIREDKDAVIPLNRPKLCAYVARQGGCDRPDGCCGPGMAVAGPDALAHFVARDHRNVSARRLAVCDQGCHVVGGEFGVGSPLSTSARVTRLVLTRSSTSAAIHSRASARTPVTPTARGTQARSPRIGWGACHACRPCHARHSCRASLPRLGLGHTDHRITGN